MYWLDKNDKRPPEIIGIEESLEKMDPTLLKEFLRALVIGGRLSETKAPEVIPDVTAAQLTEFLKQVTENRNRLFEIHLKKCSQIFSEDMKKISDEAADLENEVRSLEKNLTELKKDSTKEEEFCSRLKEKIKILEDKVAKKQEEIKIEDDQQEAKWQLEVGKD